MSEVSQEVVYVYREESIDALYGMEPEEIIEDIISKCLGLENQALPGKTLAETSISFNNEVYAMLCLREIDGISMLSYLKVHHFKNIRINHNPKYGVPLEISPKVEEYLNAIKKRHIKQNCKQKHQD